MRRCCGLGHLRPALPRDRERGERAEPDHHRADVDGGVHPVDERVGCGSRPRWRRSPPAPRLRTRRRARGSRCWHPRPGPPPRAARAERTTFAMGAKNSAIPTPARMNGTTRSPYGVVGVETDAIQAERDRLQREPGAEDQLRWNAVGHRTGDRRDEHRGDRPRQDAQPGLERRVALHRLEELGQQEDRAEHPEEHEQRGGVAERERRRAEEAHREHRRLERRSQSTNATVERSAEPERGEDLRARPAFAVPPHRGPRRSRTALRCEPDAGQVEPAGRAVVSLSRVSASGTSTRPMGTLSQKIHCQAMPSTTAPPTTGPNATARPPIAAPRAERQPSLLGGTAATQDGQRQRHHDRGAETLHGTREVEHLDAWCERRSDRGRR